jgi:hypothetical protein
MYPVELESSTEKASRIECKSCGASFERLSVCRVADLPVTAGLCGGVAVVEKMSSSRARAADRPLVVGDGGGSVCDLIAEGLLSGSSSSSPTVNDCFSLEGEAIGEGPVLLGGVDCRPTPVAGEGEEGRRNGDVRGELNERGDGL